jgi:hypothetical protein
MVALSARIEGLPNMRWAANSPREQLAVPDGQDRTSEIVRTDAPSAAASA